MDTETTLVPLWRDRLRRIFDLMEQRRNDSLEQRVVTEEEFGWFVQNVAIPAFRQFRSALAERGEFPEYGEGEDWVGFRWPDDHTLAISPLLRAPGRAAAALDLARNYRRRVGIHELADLPDVMQDDVSLWLVRQYAAYRRVSEDEIGM